MTNVIEHATSLKCNKARLVCMKHSVLKITNDAYPVVCTLKRVEGGKDVTASVKSMNM